MVGKLKGKFHCMSKANSKAFIWLLIGKDRSSSIYFKAWG